MNTRSFACAGIFFMYATAAAAQSRPLPWIDTARTAGSRPLPGPVYESPAFSRAVDQGTRTRTGLPGAKAFVQHARYSIDARIDPAAHTITGIERVVYTNNSPNALANIRIHLRQNAFKGENPRRDPVINTRGVLVSSVLVGGVVTPPSQYRTDGTVMTISLAKPLAPHDSVELGFSWSYEVPLSPSDGRQGREDHLYFAGYWYPQIAVYDDVHGWVADPYLLEAEFYMDHADYDVRITAPRGWLVGATGTLQNAADILSPDARAKLVNARRSGEVVKIARPGADARAAFAGSSSDVTWQFTARNVRDFAWGTSDQFEWDATRALVTRTAGRQDTVDIHSFYRIHPPASAWAVGGARYTRDAVEQHSRYLWPYPWPSMSSMEGVLTSGGMEYPMMTVMQPWSDTLSLAGDLMHETGHMWFPMQVGSNETRFPWMDEGFTQFNTAQSMRPLYGEPRSGGRPNDSEPGQRRQYIARARAGDDQTLMVHGDNFPQDLYVIMYYNKTSQILAALRGVLGEETFHRAFREYGARWNGKHPYPWDFFNTIEDVTKRDLSWFWNEWFFQPWSLDQAIGSVRMQRNQLQVTVVDRGLAMMPVHLTITRTDGTKQRLDVGVEEWTKTGARSFMVPFERGSSITRVEIDADGDFPDIDRTNQVWIKK